jgi:hypothetical protein
MRHASFHQAAICDGGARPATSAASFAADHRKCEQNAVRPIKHICIGQLVKRRKFAAHEMEMCHEDTRQAADDIEWRIHHFGQRDPGGCMVCSDVTSGCAKNLTVKTPLTLGSVFS